MSNTIDASKMSSKVVDAYGKVISQKEGKKDDDDMEGRFYWWKADERDMAKEIQGTIKFISTHQSTHLEQLTVSTRLYGNSNAFNFIGPALMRSAAAGANTQSSRISFNLCSSVIDTLVSKVAKNKVIPTFITSGGIWGMQKKAEQLSKFTEGMFYDQDVHEKIVNAFRDSAVWGTGILHVFSEEDEVKVERALPHEFFVDQVEALTSAPRQLHRVKIVDRDVMLNFVETTYEDGADKEEMLAHIQAQTSSAFVDLGGVGTAADLIAVSFSWHLKSGKKAKDGMYAICVGDKVVYKEEWEKEYFPFVFFKYSEGLLGFWGNGACQRLQNLQQEINRLMILDQKSRWMMSSFKILVESGSRVVSQHLNNDVGTIIYYTTTPPQYVTPPPIDPSNETKLDSLIAKGYQQEGVSQLAASSLVPLGVKSGAAMRDLDQIGDDRFLFLGQQIEGGALEVARQMIEEAKEVYARKKSFKVVFPQATFIESIDWADIKLKEDEYVLKAYPTSSLPDDPAGKLETVQEYMQAGLISPMAGRRLMAMPDVEMADKLANAPEDLIHKTLEGILNEDKFVSPEPEWNLQLASTLYLSYFNYASLNNAPPEKISMLQKWKQQLDDLNGVAQQAVQGQQAIQTLQGMQQQAQAQQQQAMANPEPAPTSPLVQNTNNPAPGGP